jgi:hypothetical protein
VDTTREPRRADAPPGDDQFVMVAIDMGKITIR